MMNEVLSHQLYRDAGVPAPRTAYARVFVTVPGKHDRKYFGLYSLVENVDKNFVADRRLGEGGAILKPCTPEVFADLGDDWAVYEQMYDPKTHMAAAEKRPSSSSAASSRTRPTQSSPPGSATTSTWTSSPASWR